MFAPVKMFAALPIAAALLTGASVASAAAPQAQAKTVEVRFGDLNLADKADQRRLHNRIARATMNVCMDASRKVDAQCRWETSQRVKAPVAQAIARAENGERFADASIGIGH